MKSLSDYPWAAPLQAGENSFIQWKQSQAKEGFLAYCLNKKIVSRKSYFEWASEIYQLPVLDHMFFENSFMKKDQWEALGGLAEWREDLMPVWVWNDVVFVGCLEPPEGFKNWPFKGRLVLVTDRALKINWKTMKRQAQTAAAPEAEPALKKPAAAGKPARRSFQNNPDRLKGAGPAGLGLPAKTAGAEASAPEEKASVRQDQHSEEMTVTNFILKPAAQDQKLFGQLWARTTPCFFSCMVLENRKGLLFPFEWTSGITADLDKSRSLISLSENSLFKVTAKGFPYHGFAPKNEGNANFFTKIGWSQFPKHVTAIPIKNQASEIEHVFLGLSGKAINERKTIKKIELTVFDFFNSRKEKARPAA